MKRRRKERRRKRWRREEEGGGGEDGGEGEEDDIRIAKLNFQLDDGCDALEAIVTCGVDDDFEEIVVESTNSAKAAIPDFDEDAMIDEVLDYMEG